MTYLNRESNGTWVFDFDVDTTVKDTDCAYDHIVLFGRQGSESNIVSAYSDASVFNYAEYYQTDNIMYEGEPITDLISDHWPVEITIT